MIQCKNWNPEGQNKIDRKHLEKFLEDCRVCRDHCYRRNFEYYKNIFFKNMLVINNSKILSQDAFDFIRSLRGKKEYERVFYEVLAPSSSMDKVSKY
ncbi:hypothetical protein [Helicobacter suis]|uniref:hypothetical protein n=1 Tax=Helicobacter suis TaxID=104628 RepID=UPI0013D4D7B0|nr:hypothetical protein [Helicobacter suis]